MRTRNGRAVLHDAFVDVRGREVHVEPMWGEVDARVVAGFLGEVDKNALPRVEQLIVEFAS